MPTIDPDLLASAISNGHIELEFTSEIPAAIVIISYSSSILIFPMQGGGRVTIEPYQRVFIHPDVIPKKLHETIGGSQSRWERLMDPKEPFCGLI